MSMRIDSRQNPRIKELAKLSKRRRRDERQVTLVEGSREVLRALVSGIVPTEAYVCLPLVEHSEPRSEARLALERLEALAADRRCQFFEVPPELFEKVAYRGDSGGLFMVIPYLPLTLDKLSLSTNPFYAVVENVEKPGNLGAILRSADAAGVDGVIVAHSPTFSPTDIHNPNTIRASLGTTFSVPMAQAATADVIDWLHERQINIVTTSPAGKKLYTDADLSAPVAIVMGSEASGVSDLWFEKAESLVTLPMHGIADSLNLSTATAIMLYEVLRQRS